LGSPSLLSKVCDYLVCFKVIKRNETWKLSLF
jgi:hypothetical protein